MKSIFFITKSDRFNTLIESFRSSGIDAHKGSSSSNLDRFDVLIVDLGHPSEMAYPLLERIGNDSRFSDKIIIAAISHKSQLSKLRSFALGCDGYISPSIEYKDVLRKIQELQDPERYLIQKNFPKIKSKIVLDGSFRRI